MKVVILAGGRGTRLSEHTEAIPKPMLDVGGKPLLQHIMDIYLAQGFNDFIIPVGYRKEIVFGYFFSLHPTFFNRMRSYPEEIKFRFPTFDVTIVDTGEDTQTGGRLARIAHLIEDERFHFTYGDGVGNVDLKRLVTTSFATRNDVTLTVVHPEGRFGRAVFMEGGEQVIRFGEKIEGESDWINGGFSILSPKVLKAAKFLGDDCNLEKDVYPVVAEHGYMNALRHIKYWKCVDTQRDLEEIRKVYKEEGAEWLKLS